MVCLRIITGLIALLYISSCGRPAYHYEPVLLEPPEIEVTLLKQVNTVHLRTRSPYKIFSLNDDAVLKEGKSLPKTQVSLNQGKLILGDKKLEADRIKIEALSGGTVELEGTAYRGEIHLIKDNKGSMTVINKLDVESYILGVVGSEMPHYWEPEALKAQAICARTFVLNLKNNGVILNSLHLAYKGTKEETPEIRRIVTQTRGVVMRYNKQIFPAYFHSTCGGHTEDAQMVFGRDGIPPLKGVRCEDCKESKYYYWRREISKQELEKKLKKAYPSLKNVREIKPLKKGQGNHVFEVEIRDANGTYRINANEFRLLLGPNHLLSTAFKAVDRGSTIKFVGGGWGHGVGLCQYGAGHMAKKGFNWQDILKKYYPGVEFVKIYN